MLYFVVLLIFLGILSNRLVEKYAFKNLTLKRTLSKNSIEIGEEVQLSIILENKKILPVSFLTIVEQCPIEMEYEDLNNITKSSNFIQHKLALFILPYQRKKYTFNVHFKKRGRYILNNITLIAGDLLGQKTFTKTISSLSNDIIVFPSSLDFNQNIKPYGNFLGNVSIKRWIIEDPILNIGIREYTGLESQKDIHWPSSIKYNRLMVKKYDYTTNYRVMIVVNIECSKPFWKNIKEDEIEKCLSITRGIMNKLEDKAIPFGFISNFFANGYGIIDKKIEPGCGSTHYYTILNLLGSAEYSLNFPFEKTLSNLLKSNVKNTTYIIVTPTLLDSYVNLINSLGEKFMKTILISFNENNFHNLNNNIISFIGKEE